MAVFLGLDLGLDPGLGGLAEAVAVSRKGTDGPESISPSLPLCLFLRWAWMWHLELPKYSYYLGRKVQWFFFSPSHLFNSGIGKLWSMGWLPVCINKVLLECSHAHLLSVDCGHLHSVTELGNGSKDCLARQSKIFALGLFGFSGTWFKAPENEFSVTYSPARS